MKKNFNPIAVMKKLMKSLMLFAAAAMALTSCENEAMNEGIESNDTYTMNFVAGAPESKTSVSIEGNNATYSWSEGDKVGFYKVANGIETSVSKAVQKKNCSSTTIAEDGTATFAVSFDAAEGATNYNIGAFYPGNSWVSHATENPFNNVQVKIPASQTLTANTFDPKADLMMSKPFMGIAIDSEDIKTLEFTRLAAIGRMNLKGVAAGETIESVTITFTDAVLNGEATLDLENSTYTLGTDNTSNTVTLTGSLVAETETPVFFTCFPAAVTGAYSVTVVTQTPDNATATYTKTGSIEKALNFTAGNVLSFNLTVGNKESVQNLPEIDATKRYIFKEATEFVGGKWYAIVANNVAATAVTGNYGYLQAEESIAVGDNISLPATNAFGFLSVDGGYTIQQYDGKYLYMTGSYSSFNVVETPTENYVYTVAIDNGTATIVNTGNTATVQYSSTHNSFGAYTTASYTNPTLYEMVEVDNGSYLLKVDPDNLSFIGAGGESTFTVSTYGEGELTVTEDIEWITATAENNTVTVVATKNENNTTREGNITVSFAGMNKTVTISQAVVVSGEAIDVLDRAFTGVTSTTYSEWSGKTSNSNAVYAGQSAGGNTSIQLRSNNSNSGIITTASGGYAKKVVVTWNSSTSSGRTLDIYGKNTAYTAATDLYSTSTQGTKLGSIVHGTSTELTISGDYQYIGMRSNYGAMYLTEIKITWATDSDDDNNEPTQLDAPTALQVDINNLEVSLTWTGSANATSYYVTCGDQTQTVTTTSAQFTMTAAGTYDVSVVAKADGYTDSEALTGTATTEAEPNPDVDDTVGATYSYDVTSKIWTAWDTGAKCGNYTWTPSKASVNGNPTVGNKDSNGRGQQFGAANTNQIKSMTMTCSDYSGGIKSIDVKTCAKNGNTVTVNVTVGGVAMNYTTNYATIANGTIATINFTSDTALTGDIVITYSLSTAGALYVSGFGIN